MTFDVIAPEYTKHHLRLFLPKIFDLNLVMKQQTNLDYGIFSQTSLNS